MQIDLDPRGRKVVIFGDVIGARGTLRRFLADGALVRLIALDTLPDEVRTSRLLRLIGSAWLVVDVGLPEPLRTRISDLAAHLHLLMIKELAAPRSGQVTLVGGGPGPTSLLTLEACKAIRQADVIFYDRLAPTKDLSELAPGVELINVGKSPYHHPMPQPAIEQAMITRAQRGESVVRLKGGDPFVLGRGGEEMQACIAAGIPVHVVPGVSSSVAVPAARGIPVTHRGISRCFTVISGHTPLETAELDGLVRLGGTIVILMGLANLAQIVAGLCRAGLDPVTPAAVVERAFSDGERSVMAAVGQLPCEVRRHDISPPAVVVVGDVVSISPYLSHSAQVIDAFDQAPRAAQAQAS